ncbi:glycoside hydrolase family 25 protein [Ruminococcus sp. Marseille-P6503]|uniref:glycoside hydrolase family 25 protein n=1 Tax=Ruminococcus sp. Marseille-P6503 TaxID=2364796 RepID=UPI000F52E7D5|nr:glycoside hydrolase family 25 protein [Ruminococcus sp. Marseille-P6503]
MKTKGIDVSYYQGEVDFKKVKAAGIDFVIIRAGYGNALAYPKQIDPRFEEYYKNAKAAGLNVGPYWYSYADSVEAAKQEAKSCLAAIKGKTFEMPIFFDLEEQKQFAKGKSFCDSIVKAFCNSLEEAGYFTGLYISRSPLQTYISADVAERYALWIAEYSSKCNYSGSYGIWQYSSKGKVSGISGNVDCDYCYVDYPTTIKKGGFNGFKKASSSSSAKPQTSAKSYTKGTQITLKNTTLYVSATAKSGVKKSGAYYIYDNAVVNNRIRITNKKSNCGKLPIGLYVTGWINKADI